MFNLAERVRAMLKKKNVSGYSLQKNFGIKQSTLSSFLNGDRNPSFSLIYEIAQALGITVSELIGEVENREEPYLWLISRLEKLEPTVVEHLRVFIENFDKKPSKSIPLIHKSNVIKILGKVAAGTPIEAVENTIGEVERSDIITKKADFGLQISGDSMEPLIHDSSIVWVKKQPTAENKQIVVARCPDVGVVCKRFVIDESKFKLVSVNSKYDDIVIDNPDYIIVGVVLNYK